MGKTYEALEMAEKEYHKKLVIRPGDFSETSEVTIPERLPIQKASDLNHEVDDKLITWYPDNSIKTILITGMAGVNGTSTIATGFASSLARDSRLKILLIDANLRSPSLHNYFNIDRDVGLTNLLIEKIDDEKIFQKVDHGNLYVIPSGKNREGPLSIFASDNFEEKLKIMRGKFDCIILDAPPVNKGVDTKVISRKVDAVILVVESGKTRKQSAIKAKKELEDAGANILGVILNRRKFYIPEWIYKRL